MAGEPIPGFLKVLREPQNGKPGLYLLAEASGPGAIVRGWSAGMDGVLRVYLDPAEGGEARSSGRGRPTDFWSGAPSITSSWPTSTWTPGDAFTQEDADYLPIPFGKGLRVTWEGELNELHFYHLQVRLYAAGTPVRTFDPKADLKTFETQARAAVSGSDQAGRRAGKRAHPARGLD